MHGDHRVPLFVGHVEQHPVTGDPGVVHHDAQATQSVGGADQLVGGIALADVAGDRDGLGAGGGDLVDHIGGIQRGGDVVDDDGRARAGQADRLRAAQSRGRAGHHRDLSG